MPIQVTTPQSQISDYIARKIEQLEYALVRSMMEVGERCVNEARSQGNYIDRTGNLRSSTGYVVAVDGEVVQMSSFDVVRNGSDGADRGKDFAMSLIQKFPYGIVLIVVAGMNYASYVSAKGYNVLESAELLAEKLVPQILGRLGLK